MVQMCLSHASVAFHDEDYHNRLNCGLYKDIQITMVCFQVRNLDCHKRNVSYQIRLLDHQI